MKIFTKATNIAETLPASQNEFSDVDKNNTVNRKSSQILNAKKLAFIWLVIF